MRRIGPPIRALPSAWDGPSSRTHPPGGGAARLRLGVLAVPIGYLTRVVEFTATHRVARADWSPEQNALEFGEASRDHAHRYQCRVTVKGPLDPAHGGVMSLATLDALLAEEVTARLHQRHVNEVIPEFAPGRWVATGEALAVYVWHRLGDRLPHGVALHAVRVQEGPDIYAEYLGEP